MKKKNFIFEFNKYFDKLWPINRRLTGRGSRKTHKILSEIIPLKTHEIKSGSKVNDWKIPNEWNVKQAYIMNAEGKKIKAEECLELGLTNKIVEEGELLESAIEWAKTLAAKATIAIGITKEDLVHAMDNSLNDSIAYEAEKQIAAFESYDLVEGVAAFVEKRKANFIGK